METSMEKISRRNFLKAGACAGTVLALAGNISQTESQTPSGAAVTPAIRHRTLGSTGWNVCEIGFGAMNMRDPELVRAAFEAGINYFDTSSNYQNGRNEEVLGSVLSSYRDKVFITTKLEPESNATKVLSRMESSLKRLRTDHVDAVLVHSGGVKHVKSQQFIDTYGLLRQKGLTRFVGISAHSNIPAVLDAMTASRFWQLATVSYNFNSNQKVTDAITRARKAGIALVAMKTQNRGRGGAKLASGTMTANQGALRWVLQNKNIDTTIPGMTAFEHLAEDMKVMNMALTSDDGEELRRYGESLKGTYCSGILGCTGCLNQCPHGVEIHEINRCLGYAFGYGNLQLARENYDLIPSHARVDACSNCDTCKVHCVNGLNLDETIHHARALFC